ncbi:MAG: AAA family ATPase [Pirellulaceae bacterium]|nr:AAA family ATPase [Pirellulaceae bacterium]
MSSSSDNSTAILGLLSGKRSTTVEPDPWNSGNARPPASDDAKPLGNQQDAKLAEMLCRIQQMTAPDTRKALPTSTPSADGAGQPVAIEKGAGPNAPLDAFIPIEPVSIREAGLTDTEVESLILKYLLARGDMTGREIAEQIRMPFILLDQLMRQLKLDQLLIYRGAAPMNDYVYQLTDLGRERDRRYLDHCTYYGAAPVALADYITGIEAQSLTKQHPTEEDLAHAFSDILVNKRMLTRLGPAINSGRGMFLFGSAGNGKTTIAERVTRAFGQFIWIPRAIGIDGEIIRLFDPVNHEESPPPANSALWNCSKIDQRWVRIRRPTIVVGGELTMESLEVCLNRSTGISEAPLQLKSNCGTLVIDDFGRQKMSTDQLLNRWIVPLEKRYDYLNLPNGKKIQVPFDQLIVFSTNLEPRDLVDEAFLRRIPYKIEIINPSEEEFRGLFKYMCPKLGFEYDEASLDYLIETHYKAKNRPFRACQPRDLLTQVKNHCFYKKLPPRMSCEFFDLAVENYFAVM